MMKTKQLKELLLNNEYQVTKFYGEENKATPQDIKSVEYYGEDKYDIFHDNMTADGKPPKYTDYLKKFLLYCVPKFIKDKERQPTEGELHAFVGRANNLYISKMAELSLEVALKEYLPSNIKVISDIHIDRGFGVDYVLEIDGEKYLYLHVFSDTKWGWSKFHSKEAKKGRTYDKYGRVAWSTRTKSEYHFALAYVKNYYDYITGLCSGKDVVNNLVGNIPVFESVVVDKVMERINQGNLDVVADDKCTEFERFIYWCDRNLVDVCYSFDEEDEAC